MKEYNIVRISRRKEEKTREIEGRRGKTHTERYIEVETIEDFDIRVKVTLNELGKQGWQVINASYSLPIKDQIKLANMTWIGTSTSDAEAMEFVFVLERSTIKD